MHRIMACVVFVAVAVASSTGAQERKAEAILVKVDAHDLAREFEKDPKEARRKYDPNPAKGVLGGTIIQIHGIVARVNDRARTITLDTGTKLSVVLQAKKITRPDQQSRKMAAEATGRFSNFARNTVVITCDDATLLRIIGEKK
jgi:hypothetical protein